MLSHDSEFPDIGVLYVIPLTSPCSWLAPTMNVLRSAVRHSKAYSTIIGKTATGSRFYSTTSRLCPSCSSPLTTALPTCTKCYHIQPLPRDTSYYDIFDLSQTQNAFKIDTKDLRQRFLQAQRICHPDAWSVRGEVRSLNRVMCTQIESLLILCGKKERLVAEEQSSLLNEAYKTLLSPVTRAQYILTQEGYPPSETDKLTDPELLMEIMEAREQLEEAETPPMVDEIRSGNIGMLNLLYPFNPAHPPIPFVYREAQRSLR